MGDAHAPFAYMHAERAIFVRTRARAIAGRTREFRPGGLETDPLNYINYIYVCCACCVWPYGEFMNIYVC